MLMTLSEITFLTLYSLVTGAHYKNDLMKCHLLELSLLGWVWGRSKGQGSGILESRRKGRSCKQEAKIFWGGRGITDLWERFVIIERSDGIGWTAWMGVRGRDKGKRIEITTSLFEPKMSKFLLTNSLTPTPANVFTMLNVLAPIWRKWRKGFDLGVLLGIKSRPHICRAIPILLSYIQLCLPAWTGVTWKKNPLTMKM